MQIVVDAMGSDNHPTPDVTGAIQAAKEWDLSITLVGDQAQIEAQLAQHKTAASLPITVQHAPQTISMDDKPSDIIKSKPHSSMHIGLSLVQSGQADAFVTMGNTGAALGVAMLRKVGLGRIAGVKRPALGVIFPTNGYPLLVDGGANADCRPDYLLQFALMGSVYMQKVQGHKTPTVGLIANGEEEGKGTTLIRETAPLLANSGLNYVGFIEPKEFVAGDVNVAVTDGFTGNIIMKTSEAIASSVSSYLRQEIRSSLLTTLGGLLARPAFGRVRNRMQPEEIGGVPLLGVNGVVIIGHGRSNARAVKQAIGQARLAVSRNIVSAIATGLAGLQT